MKIILKRIFRLTDFTTRIWDAIENRLMNLRYLKLYKTITGKYYLPYFAKYDMIKNSIIKNEIFDKKVYEVGKKYSAVSENRPKRSASRATKAARRGETAKPFSAKSITSANKLFQEFCPHFLCAASMSAGVPGTPTDRPPTTASQNFSLSPFSF